MFDTKTETFKEWPVPQYSTPYAASIPDRNGFVYATSNMAEQVFRLNPETGDVIGYQIPTDFDSKEIIQVMDAGRTVFWMANTRSARLIRVEPLD
jgi:streptogramin lyase